MPTPAPVLAVNVWHNGATPGGLVVLDAATLLPVTGSTFATAETDNASVVSPDNRWLAICAPQTGTQLMDLTATPLALGPVIPRPTGGAPVGVVFSRDSSKLYVVSGSTSGKNAVQAITVTGSTPGTVLWTVTLWTTLAARAGQNLATYTDPTSGEWVMVPSAGPFPSARAPGAPNQVAFINATSTTTPRPVYFVTVGVGPDAVAISGTTGYVANYTDKTLGKLDLTPLPSAPPIYTATALPVGVGAPPYWVQVVGASVYVSCTAFTGVDPSITVVSQTTFAIIRQITATLVGPTAGGPSPDQTRFFSATTDLVHQVYRVSVITVASGTVIEKLTQTGITAGAAVSSGTVAPPGLGALLAFFAALGTGTPHPITGTGALGITFQGSGTGKQLEPATAQVTGAFTASATAITVIPATGGMAAAFVATAASLQIEPSTASLVATFTGAATGTAALTATASMTASFTATATPLQIVPGTAQMSATFTGGATGVVVQPTTASCSTTFAAAAAGSVVTTTQAASGAMAATFTASGTPVVVQGVTANLTASFSATGVSLQVVPATGTLNVAFGATATPLQIEPTTATSTATFTATATSTGIVPATGSLVTTFSASGAPVVVQGASSGVTATFVATAAGAVVQGATATFAATFAATAAGVVVQGDSGTLVASFAGSATVLQVEPTTGAVTATFSASTAGVVVQSTAAVLVVAFTARAVATVGHIIGRASVVVSDHATVTVTVLDIDRPG